MLQEASRLGSGFAAVPDFLLKGHAAEFQGPLWSLSDQLLVRFARSQGIHDPRGGHLPLAAMVQLSACGQRYHPLYSLVSLSLPT